MKRIQTGTQVKQKKVNISIFMWKITSITYLKLLESDSVVLVLKQLHGFVDSFFSCDELNWLLS